MYLLQLYFRLTSIAILTLLILTNSNAVNASSIIESSFNTSQNSSQEPQTTSNGTIFFKLYCRNRQIHESNPDEVLVTWIQRKPESTIDLPSDLEPFEKYQFDRDNHLWYDAIATLSDLHFKNPENPEISEAWSELLESLMIVEELPEDLSNLEWLAEESLVNSELYPL